MACKCNENGKTINIEMGCCVPIVANADAYYTKSQVDEKIDEIISSGCCITPEEVDEKISAATDGLASEEWVADQHYLTDADLSDYALKTDIPTVPTSNTAFTNDAGYITQDSITGKADTTAVTEVNNTLTAHTANTNIHITTAQSAAWDAKSDFSGSYNDLTDKPTSNTAFTNDAGYITIDAISGKADTSAVTEELSSKQNTLVSGANIKTINNLSLLGSGNIDIQGSGSGVTSGEVQTMIDESISGKADTSAVTEEISSATSGKVDTSTFETYSGSVETALSDKQDVSGMTAYTTTAATDALNGVVTAHTANTDIHITTAQSAAWDAKSDFSGSYNDLSDKPTIPTVPTSNTAFTNDAGYITQDALSGYAESSAVTEEIAEATSGFQETLVSGQNIKTINNLSLLGEGNITIEGGGGGGGVYNAGRGIAIDSSNIISSTLPIYSGSVADSVIIGDSGLTSTGQFSIVGGFETSAISECSFVVGNRTKAINNSEAALGHYNVSNSGSSEIFFGDDRNTLFSVGNGYTTAQRHNAVEIMQNGDIYIADTNDEATEYYYEKPMIKLQDALIVDQELNNASSKAIANSAVTEALSEKQDISGMTAYTTTATTSALNTVVTAHTANTLIHVTQEDKGAWDAKSDFSGDYNDLTNKPTIPTVPTSNTAFTNDAGYQTATDVSNAISGKADTSAVTEVMNTLDVHTANTYIHVSANEKTNWNNKVDNTTYTAYTASTNTALNGKVDSSTFRVYSATTDAALSEKADTSAVTESLSDKQDVSGMTAYTTTATTSALNGVVTAHTANTDIHITTAQSAAWDAKCETPTYHTVTLNADGSVRSAASTLVYSTIKANLQDPQKADYLELLWENGVGSNQYSRLLAKCVGITNTENGLLRFEATFVNGDGLLMIIILTLDSENTLSTFGVMISPETTLNKVQSVVSNSTSTVFYPSAKAIFDEFQRKPVVVWENTENSGLTSSEQNISTSMTWQLTNLDMTPYKRVKIYTKAGRKDSGVGVDASNTPAVVLEMSLDDRAKSPVGGHFLGSVVGQKPNDTNRLFTVVCAISSDKTSFAVLRMTTLYGTAATTNSDVNGYVFKIEGYFD